MPLPVGFKVNGSKVGSANRVLVTPRMKKIMTFLDRFPTTELITTEELAGRLGLSSSGSVTAGRGLVDYREKVDGKLFWGSQKSIAQLRKKLAEPEETQNED